ncbi:hypothetical protein B0H66DRAFT_575197 [Apodospora peruviana]|uniref:DUF7924 domain-containing protein n=1 Tax=Apodospora peruviana TaxID=516989 RepID=A0AAE0I621_9PEZI|nr:hypothetical protein B0H66DRAFT_575197 [Apodospora peruviana]
MARPQNLEGHCENEAGQDNPPAKSRKRQHADEPSRDDHPATRPRAGETSHGDCQDNPPVETVEQAVGHHDSWHYPPEFWDRLSKIPLVHNVLKEFDRRTCIRPSFPLHPTEQLARFARHGGPDLSDLRGHPTTGDRPADAMSSSSRSRATKSTDPTSIQTSSKTAKTKTSKSAYDRGFEQHLADNTIHPTYTSGEPANLDEIQVALQVPRPSLSPSAFSVAAFKAYRAADAQAKDEEDVLHDVIPTITGQRQDHVYVRKTKCTNLESLTDGTIAPAYPDIYYGARPEELDRSVRDELSGHIRPSTMEGKPIAPNLFLEVKGRYGTPAVAAQQARYDGAIGARGMHSLQNYGNDEPVFDGNAYTYSATYQSGLLQVYAHHPTTPTTPGDRPEYHMTQVDTWGMTGNRGTFIRGATAFRNARDLAKTHRDGFIQAANARVPPLDAKSSSGPGDTDATYVLREELASWEDGVDYGAEHAESTAGCHAVDQQQASQGFTEC